LEKSSGSGRLGGGVRIPPNLTKILVDWGLEEELKKRGIECPPTNLPDCELRALVPGLNIYVCFLADL
jgi:salicylate hydroxylase